MRPADVIVMTPDIDTYAPYIEAVFAAAPRSRHIPYSIADRVITVESAIVASFFALLELGRSRFDASAVLALLERAAVQRRFGLSPEDVSLMRRWVRESGIRWGVDAKSREEMDLPAFADNTWCAGLDRLMLGYALPQREGELFAGNLPWDDIEGSRAQTLGRLHAFATRLFALAQELRQAKTVERWVETLAESLETFFRPVEAEETDVQAIRRALAEMARTTAQAGFAEEVGLDPIRHHLRRTITEPTSRGQFLSGGVTFCALMPMRSLPAKVVCLIGMNDGSFPRVQRPPGFDLMANDFRRGDRSRRNDDRYLFLETILAAREVLYVSYVGQSVRDNANLPPSVLVAELLDYVKQAFLPESGKDVREEIVTRHPLQPFSARYFHPGGRAFQLLPRARPGEPPRHS